MSKCPRCGGDDDGKVYTSNPPQNKCSRCGEHWVCGGYSDWKPPKWVGDTNGFGFRKPETFTPVEPPSRREGN